MYEVEVSAPGLSATIAVEVKPGTTSVVPIELGMATVASTVSVAASEPPLIEESAQKNTIGGRIVQEAPNQNEKIESLLPLVPGVVRGPISTRLRLRVRLRPHHDIFLSQDGQLIGLSFADRYELVPAGFTTR
jgi:hypothetical protein